jgi:hypothetical protein
MKRYCQQCSTILLGQDSLDLAVGTKGKPSIFCSGCGFIAVNENGRCLTHKTHLQFFPKLIKGVEVSPGFLEAGDKIVTDPMILIP